MIFVDTSAWFAAVVPWDSFHSPAQAWLQQPHAPLFTTDFIIDETLTLLRAKGEASRAILLGSQFFGGTDLTVVYHLTADDLRKAWTVFRQFSDKDWSFTDCTSKVIMQSQGIASAFSFDRHFRQFGSVTVVP